MNAYLVFAGNFLITVVLVDDEVIGKHKKRYPGYKHFEQTCSFVPSVAHKSLVAPKKVDVTLSVFQ